MNQPTIHTIPVPHGSTPEQAWEQHKRGRPLTLEQQHGCYWANIRVQDGRYLGVAGEGL